MPAPELSFSHSLLIDKHHPSLAGHFPDNPVVPGVVILDQVLQIWQKQTNKTVLHINNAKFVNLLTPGSNCVIKYQDLKNKNIDFSIVDDVQSIIAKGRFFYDG